MDLLNRPLTQFLDQLGSEAPAPAAIPAAAMAAAMGLALFEKAMRHPQEGLAPGKGREDLEVIVSLRRKLAELAAADVPLYDGLAEAQAAEEEEEASSMAGARLQAYRSARRVVDISIQGLTQIQKPLDMGSVAMLADIEAGWRLLAAGMESAIACCEDHLKHIESAFAEGESSSLRRQAQQGREWVGRAQGALSWRRGKV